MKVAVEIKITLLEGEEKGRTFTDKKLMYTESEISEMGVIERLDWVWRYVHTMAEPQEVRYNL